MKECCKYFGCSLSTENENEKNYDVYVCVVCKDAWKFDSITKEAAMISVEDKEKHLQHYGQLRNHIYAMQAQKDKVFADQQKAAKEKLLKMN